MDKKPFEWFKQAEYDIKSAEIMFENRRYIYTVFMCHLALEKAIKGLYVQKLNDIPPRTHNLVFLVEKLGGGIPPLALPEDLYDFIFMLTGVSVQTRYPDELERMKKDYPKAKTKKLLDKTKEALTWLKSKL